MLSVEQILTNLADNSIQYAEAERLRCREVASIDEDEDVNRVLYLPYRSV